MTDENWTIIPAHEAVDILAQHFGSSPIQLSIARQWLENEIARGRMVFLADSIKIYRVESDCCELCKEIVTAQVAPSRKLLTRDSAYESTYP
jgi:hypothetical protein